MHKEWPTDNLLDDIADEYATMLYPSWDFRRYGVRNPWAFRLAVKAALVVTDDGDPLLDPEQLIYELDWYMKDEVREEEGCLKDDDDAEDEAEMRMKAIRSFLLEHIGILSLTDEELENLMKPASLEELEDKVLDGIHDMVAGIVVDAADLVRAERS